jgi:predicted NBD/HSP70 family sugar kinase
MATVADVAIAEHKGMLTRADLLGLTSVLFEVAAAGDLVARDVLARQADEICVLAANALRQLGVPPDGVPVVLGGGVLESRNPLLLGMVSSRLATLAPGAVPRVVDVPPVAGAALLGLDHRNAGPAAAQRLRESYRASLSTSSSSSGLRGVRLLRGVWFMPDAPSAVYAGRAVVGLC